MRNEPIKILIFNLGNIFSVVKFSCFKNALQKSGIRIVTDSVVGKWQRSEFNRIDFSEYDLIFIGSDINELHDYMRDFISRMTDADKSKTIVWGSCLQDVLSVDEVTRFETFSSWYDLLTSISEKLALTSAEVEAIHNEIKTQQYSIFEEPRVAVDCPELNSYDDKKVAPHG